MIPSDNEIKSFQDIEAKKKEIVYLRFVLDSFDSSFLPNIFKFNFNQVRLELLRQLDSAIYFYRQVSDWYEKINSKNHEKD